MRRREKTRKKRKFQRMTAGMTAALLLLGALFPAGAAEAEEQSKQGADGKRYAAETEMIETQGGFSNLEVGGVALYEEGVLTGNTIPGITFNPVTSTLTLNNYKSKDKDNSIISSGIRNLKIELIGENVIESQSLAGIYFCGDERLIEPGSLTIGGEGSLTIEMAAQPSVNIFDYWHGVQMGGLDSFYMDSGELNLVTTGKREQFVGFQKWTPGQDKFPADFNFLGGTVNIKSDLASSAKGFEAFCSNIIVKDAVINIELQGAEEACAVDAGIYSESESKMRGGKLIVDNGTINCTLKDCGKKLPSMRFYEMNDLSRSLIYVGRRAANRKAEFKDVFEQVEEKYGGIFWETDYEYITISPEPIEVQMAFDDVRDKNGYKDWYYDYVKYVFENEIMTGKNDILFGAADNLARAQFAVILHRMNGKPETKYTAKFPDVKDGQWYTEAILWANSIDVVKGYEHNGLFGTADDINREQMAVMMYRYAEYKKYDTSKKAEFSKFEDASKVNAFAKEAMQWAVGEEIITGKDGGKRLDPQGKASRAECAAIIMRFMEKYKAAYIFDEEMPQKEERLMDLAQEEPDEKQEETECLKVKGVTIYEDGTLTDEILPGITYDAETSTLTLNHYKGTDICEEEYDGIYAVGISDLKIELVGENVLDIGGNAGIYYVGDDQGKETGCLTIGGEGSLSIRLSGVWHGYGIQVGSYDSFLMESGELNISTTKSLYGFYGIRKEAVIDDEGKSEFRFTDCVVNINADSVKAWGIEAGHSNITIKDAEINVNLKGNLLVTGISTGWHSAGKDKVYGGILTIDHAVINCKAEEGHWRIENLNFYEVKDLGDSLYYAGRRAPNRKVSLDMICKVLEKMGNLYVTDYEYVTISPEPIKMQMAFDDVRNEQGSKDWYYDYVKYVFENEIMTGKNELQFAPSDNLARAQFAVILHRMNGEPEVAYTAKFPDVQEGRWYTDAILWANSIDVVKGYEHNGLFGTADDITREQMAVMMYRYAQYKKYDTSEKAEFTQFTDASKVNAFAKEAMQWAVGAEIITGKDNGKKLDPQGIASRAECAAIIMRFMEKYKV